MTLSHAFFAVSQQPHTALNALSAAGVRTVLWGVLVLATLSGHAACPSDEAVKAYLKDFGQRRISAGFERGLSQADAECARQKLVAKLPLYLGQPMGYKLGFTSAAAQQQFEVDGPQWGVMFNRNMVDIIAVLPATFGARPYFEADLLVEVKDEGLADARTPLEALAHLESVVPFIELPDLMLEGAVKGRDLVAINMAFRGGVTGAEIPLQAHQATADALATMTVVMRDLKSGQELGRAPGSAIMGHPLNAAMHLAQALKAAGIRLKKGDMLSLGSFLPAKPTQSGQHIEVQYLGLPGNPAVTVEFN